MKEMDLLTDVSVFSHAQWPYSFFVFSSDEKMVFDIYDKVFDFEEIEVRIDERVNLVERRCEEARKNDCVVYF